MSSSEYTNNNASMGAFSKAKDLQKKIFIMKKNTKQE